jgi:hypothetical protein
MCSCRLLWGKPGAGEATYKKIDWKQIQLISHVSFQQQSHGSSSSDELPFSPVFGKSELVKSPSEAERDRRAKRCFTLWFTDNTSMMRNGVRAMWGTGSSYKHTLDVECASEVSPWHSATVATCTTRSAPPLANTPTLLALCVPQDARNFLVQGFMLLWKHTWKDQGYNPDDFCGFQIDSFGRYKFKQYEKTYVAPGRRNRGPLPANSPQCPPSYCLLPPCPFLALSCSPPVARLFKTCAGMPRKRQFGHGGQRPPPKAQSSRPSCI